VIVLEFVLISAVPTPTAVPVPHILLEIIRYGSTNLAARERAHCHYRLRSFNALLLSHVPSYEQCVYLASIKAVIIPIKPALKLPEIPISD
jgi:hypothetical protein